MTMHEAYCNMCGHVQSTHPNNGRCTVSSRTHDVLGECMCSMFVTGLVEAARRQEPPAFILPGEKIDVPGHEQWTMPMEAALLLRRLMVDIVNHDMSERCTNEEYHRALSALPPVHCGVVARIKIGGDREGGFYDTACVLEPGHTGKHRWEGTLT